MQLVSFLLILLFEFSFGTKNLPEGVYYISLDSSGNTSLYWSIDYDQKFVTFEIHLSLRKWDWFAIGFSDYGEFYPADYCILWSNREWKTEFRVSFLIIKIILLLIFLFVYFFYFQVCNYWNGRFWIFFWKVLVSGDRSTIIVKWHQNKAHKFQFICKLTENISKKELTF